VCYDDLQNNLLGKLIPVPFSLGIIVIGIVGLTSKILYHNTFIPSFIVSLGSVLQIGCSIL
jgi:ABC-type xylose transport system permease subunit